MSFTKGKDSQEGGTGTYGMGAGPVGSTSGAPRVEAFLGRGTKVVGTLTFSGPAEVDGHVEGEIIAQDRLTIGESAVINGKLTGGDVVVKGNVTGDVTANRRLSLRRPAQVVGNLSAPVLSIEEGVIFEGKCVMPGAAQTAERTGNDRGIGQQSQQKPTAH